MAQHHRTGFSGIAIIPFQPTQASSGSQTKREKFHTARGAFFVWNELLGSCF